MKENKRFFLGKADRSRGLWIILALCVFMTACGQKPADNAPLPACAALVETIASGQPFEELTALGESQILAYLDIEEGKLADMAMSMDASRATAEVIVALTAKDADGLTLAQEALRTYRETTLAQYADYRPEETPKLEAAVLETKGMQTVLIVSPDAGVAKKSLDGAWK